MYYTLIPTRHATVGKPAPAMPDDAELPAFTHPRLIEIANTVDLFGERDEIEHLLDGRMSLVSVGPLGPVEPGRIDNQGPEVLCADGWRVHAVLPLEQLLGPSAAAIRDVVSAAMSITQEADYDDAVCREDDLDDVVEQAKTALDAAWIDADWWGEQVGCTRGYEVVALAARDQINENSRWNQQAFQTLMRPWRSVMGWPAEAPASQ